MSKSLKDDFEEIEVFLNIAKTVDKFRNCGDVYELFGFKKSDTFPEIETKITEFVREYSASTAVKYKYLKKTVPGAGTLIIRVMRDSKHEYDNYLKCKVKEKLKELFIFSVEKDKELQIDEEESIIEKGVALGISQSEIIGFIDSWLLKYKAEREKKGGKKASVDKLTGKSYYEILNVAEDADYKDIKAAYNREHQKYINSRDKVKASAIFTIVAEAHEILKNPRKRKEYDKELRIKRESKSDFSSYLDFRSGEKATDPAEAVVLIDKYWEEAKNKFVQGDLAGWLGRNGKTVLAEDLRAINKIEEDKDIALEKAVQAFKLGRNPPDYKIKPDSINLKAEHGAQINKTITIANISDRGFLYGKVDVPNSISLSSDEIRLKPHQSKKIDIAIDTKGFEALKKYNFPVKIHSNSNNQSKGKIALYISYPIRQSIKRFAAFGFIGALIGLVLRGLLAMAHFPNWLHKYYNYMSWMDIWDKNFSNNEIIIPFIFIGVLGSFFLIAIVIKRQ